LAAQAAGSVTLLERPVHTTTLIRSLEVALNSRRRQYQVRDFLEEQHRKQCELEQAQESLHRAKQFDDAVMENMGEGLYTVDSQGSVTFMNPAAEQLFGWTFGELRGRNIHDAVHYKYPDGRHSRRGMPQSAGAASWQDLDRTRGRFYSKRRHVLRRRL
jgi:PAS domain S-box